MSFEKIKTLGTYAWTPTGDYKECYSDITANDILRCLDQWSVPPEKIVEDVTSLAPGQFMTLQPDEYKHIFPHASGRVVSLYIAVKKFGHDLSQIDFLFGGSTLNMFAEKCIPVDGDTKLIAQKCRNVIMVFKHKSYTMDYNLVGYQFERLVTGKPVEQRHDTTQHERLSLWRIDGHNVMFCAEIDAIDHVGNPVEIKASNPRQFERQMKVMFQMISSGSETLVMADRRGNKLDRIRTKTIGDMIAQHSKEKLNLAQNNILHCIKILKKNLQNSNGEPYEIDFDDDGKMSVLPSNLSILPDDNLLAELLD